MSDLPPVSSAPLRRRRAILVIVALVVIFVAAGSWYFWHGSSSSTTTAAEGSKGKAGKGGRFAQDANRPQPVAVAQAKTADVNVVQTALGTVSSWRAATVRPRVDGLLQSVSFGDGELVKPGATLAQIDPEPFRVQLEQVEGQLARDSAQLANARLDLTRYRTLIKEDSIAAQQVDQQAALVRQLEGTVKIDQAQVDNAKLQLSYTRITAPIGGRLGLRLVDPGNMVHTSDTSGIVVITEVDPIGALFTIPQDTLPRVLARLRRNDKPAVEAWSQDQKTLLARGSLITTDNQIDIATGTVKLKAQFPNHDGILFPNQFVNIRMVVDVVRNAVVVPTAAIQRNAQGGYVVYVVKDDSTVEVRPITPGPAEGLNTAIEKGLQPGERVVTDGVDRIREGSKVVVASPEQANAPPPAPGGDKDKRGKFGGEKTGGEKGGLFQRKSEGKGFERKGGS